MEDQDWTELEVDALRVCPIVERVLNELIGDKYPRNRSAAEVFEVLFTEVRNRRREQKKGEEMTTIQEMMVQALKVLAPGIGFRWPGEPEPPDFLGGGREI